MIKEGIKVICRGCGNAQIHRVEDIKESGVLLINPCKVCIGRSYAEGYDIGRAVGSCENNEKETQINHVSKGGLRWK